MTADPRTRGLGALALALALALGCGSSGSDDGAGEAGDDSAGDGDSAESGGSSGASGSDIGTMELSFTVGGAVPGSMNLVDPLMGTVYGGIFRTAEVGATGPREDAVQIAFVEVAVDLTTEMASPVVWTSDPLEPETYTFLGFFDVDGSSAATEEKDPEEGDPVTLPTANHVKVEAGAAAQLEVTFDLVL